MKRKIFTIIISAILITSFIPSIAFADDPATKITDDVTVDSLAFFSDAHNFHSQVDASDGCKSSNERLDKIIPVICNNEKDIFETVVGCGDYGNARTHVKTYYGSEEDTKTVQKRDYWKLSKEIFDAVDNSSYIKSDKNTYICGNHEWDQGQIATNNDSNTKRVLKSTGEVCKTDDYILYAFGAQTKDMEFMQSDIDALDTYLATAPDDRPIFIVSHYALHSEISGYNERNPKNKDKVVEMLNKYENKQIIFLWGHNHSDAGKGEDHYDKFFTDSFPTYVRGSSPSTQQQNINFTYASAGCMSDLDYYNEGSPSVKGKILVASVDKNDHTVTLKYYQIENGSYTVLNNATEITNSCKLEQIKLIEEFNNIAYKLTASQKEEWEAKLKNCNNLEDLKALASQLEEVKQQIEDDQQIEDEPITVNTIKAKYYNGQKQTGTFYFKQNGKTIATKKVSRTKPGTYYTEDVNGVKGKLVVKVKGTSISSLKAGKKSFTIKVYKRAKANVTGYQLRFSLKSNMKKNRIKTISTKYTKVSNTFKKLKSTKYYVQVRTYKTISGKKYYSAWSKYTTVKVK